MVVHFTVRIRFAVPVLVDPPRCRWLWRALRRNFPDAFSVVLMPTHIHIVLEAADTVVIRRKLAKVLAAFSRRFGLGQVWERVPPGEAVEGREHLQRMVRYVHLNPCRRTKIAGRWVKLVDDPLCWRFSTWRDVTGAVAVPWVTAERLADLLELGHDPLGWLNDFTTRDPSVAVEGVALPVPARPASAPVFSLRAICLAAAEATRSAPGAIEHKGPTRVAFLALARDQGWTDTALLARLTRCSTRTVMRSAHCGEGEEDASIVPLLNAAALCLGDERILRAAGWKPGLSLVPSNITSPFPKAIVHRVG